MTSPTRVGALAIVAAASVAAKARGVCIEPWAIRNLCIGGFQILDLKAGTSCFTSDTTYGNGKTSREFRLELAGSRLFIYEKNAKLNRQYVGLCNTAGGPKKRAPVAGTLSEGVLEGTIVFRSSGSIESVIINSTDTTSGLVARAPSLTTGNNLMGSAIELGGSSRIQLTSSIVVSDAGVFDARNPTQKLDAFFQITPESLRLKNANIVFPVAGDAASPLLKGALSSDGQVVLLVKTNSETQLKTGRLKGATFRSRDGTTDLKGITVRTSALRVRDVSVVANDRRLRLSLASMRCETAALRRDGEAPLLLAEHASTPVTVQQLMGTLSNSRQNAVLELEAIHGLKGTFAEVAVGLHHSSIRGGGTVIITELSNRRAKASVELGAPTFEGAGALKNALTMGPLRVAIEGPPADMHVAINGTLLTMHVGASAFSWNAGGATFSVSGPIRGPLDVNVSGGAGEVHAGTPRDGLAAVVGEVETTVVRAAKIMLGEPNEPLRLAVPPGGLEAQLHRVRPGRDSLLRGLVAMAGNARLTNPEPIAIEVRASGRLRYLADSIEIANAKCTSASDGKVHTLGKLVGGGLKSQMSTARTVPRLELASLSRSGDPGPPLPQAGVDVQLESGDIGLQEGELQQDDVQLSVPRYETAGLVIERGASVSIAQLRIRASNARTVTTAMDVRLGGQTLIRHEGAPAFSGILRAGAAVQSARIVETIGEGPVRLERFDLTGVHLPVADATYQDNGVRLDHGTGEVDFEQLSLARAKGRLRLDGASAAISKSGAQVGFSLDELHLQFEGEKANLSGNGRVKVRDVTFSKPETDLRVRDGCSLPFSIKGMTRGGSGTIALAGGRISGDLAIPTGTARIANRGHRDCSWTEHLPGITIGYRPCPTLRKPWRFCPINTPRIPVHLRLDIDRVVASGRLENVKLRFQPNAPVDMCGGNLDKFDIQQPLIAGVSWVPVGGFIGQKILGPIISLANRAWQSALASGLGQTASLLRNLGVGPGVHVLGGC